MNSEKWAALEPIISEKHTNMAGIVVRHKGEIRYTNYFNACTATSPVHVFSVTKSIVSLLIGIALDRGLIGSLDQPVLDFFPDYRIKRGEKTLQQITLRHLLTMTAPYKYKSAPYTRFFTSDDWVTASLDLLGGKGQIGEFRYTPLIGPDILSGILVRATGQSVLDFATECLFAPLGITVASSVIFQDKEEHFAFLQAKAPSGWVADPNGVNTAGWGLTLTAMDMATIGQLCLDGGKWQGNRLVSAEWINENTREHSRWEQLNLPYGYLWWTGIADGYAAMGDCGNVIYVNPRKHTVVAIASLYKPRAKDCIELIQTCIEPLLEQD